jgi:hypothetical protein
MPRSKRESQAAKRNGVIRKCQKRNVAKSVVLQTGAQRLKVGSGER